MSNNQFQHNFLQTLIYPVKGQASPVPALVWATAILSLDIPDTYAIDKIDYLRNQSTPARHECLDISVKIPDQRSNAHLLVERTQAMENSVWRSSAALFSSSISSSSSSSSSDSSNPALAHDAVIPFDSSVKPWPAYVIITSRALFGTVSLHDFARVLLVVNEYAPHYHLMLNQCYWFAEMIFGVVLALSTGDMSPSNHPYYYELRTNILLATHILAKVGGLSREKLLPESESRKQIKILLHRFHEKKNTSAPEQVQRLEDRARAQHAKILELKACKFNFCLQQEDIRQDTEIAELKQADTEKYSQEADIKGA